MKKYMLMLFFLMSSTVFAERDSPANSLIYKKEGWAMIQINPSTLYPVRSDMFDMVLEWPEINSWSQTIHPTVVKWLSINRNEKIQQALQLAASHSGVLTVKVSNVISVDTRYYNPGCKPRPFVTCEDLGFPPKKVVETWDIITINIPPNLKFESFVLLSKKISDI